MALDVTGQWHIQQLIPQLQAIIAKHRNHFDGEVVPDPRVGVITLEGLPREFRPSYDAGDNTRTMRLEWSTIRNAKRPG
jgi:hypothetical protein